MPTDKPRYNLTVDPELLEEINIYQRLNGISSQNKAIVNLIRKGLIRENTNVPSHVLSKEDLTILAGFRTGNQYIRDSMLKLASNAASTRRMRNHIDPIENPMYDAITLLMGYETASPEIQHQIDALINQALLTSKDSAVSEEQHDAE